MVFKKSYIKLSLNCSCSTIPPALVAQDPTRALNFWASSHTVMTFLSRPYSNQTESLVYAVLIVLCTTTRLGARAAFAIGIMTGSAAASFIWCNVARLNSLRDNMWVNCTCSLRAFSTVSQISGHTYPYPVTVVVGNVSKACCRGNVKRNVARPLAFQGSVFASGLHLPYLRLAPASTGSRVRYWPCGM